jgi:hypothetical protein
MSLVDDEQTEAVAEDIHVTECALEGEHGDPLDPSLAVADQAHARGKMVLELGEPRARERARGAQNGRWQTRLEQGSEGHTRLARSRGQHHDAAPTECRPGGECLMLVRPERQRRDVATDDRP